VTQSTRVNQSDNQNGSGFKMGIVVIVVLLVVAIGGFYLFSQGKLDHMLSNDDPSAPNTDMKSIDTSAVRWNMISIENALLNSDDFTDDWELISSDGINELRRYTSPTRKNISTPTPRPQLDRVIRIRPEIFYDKSLAKSRFNELRESIQSVVDNRRLSRKSVEDGSLVKDISHNQPLFMWLETMNDESLRTRAQIKGEEACQFVNTWSFGLAEQDCLEGYANKYEIIGLHNNMTFTMAYISPPQGTKIKDVVKMATLQMDKILETAATLVTTPTPTPLPR